MSTEFENIDLGENPTLKQTVTNDTVLKEWLVNYVGEKKNPVNDEVTVEMILDIVADEFPEFILPIAEENFIRGYRQALIDVEYKQETSSKSVKKTKNSTTKKSKTTRKKRSSKKRT